MSLNYVRLPLGKDNTVCDMLEPCQPGTYRIPTGFIHEITKDKPIFWNMDMERKLHVFLSAYWENALFAQGFHEVPLNIPLNKRLEAINNWKQTFIQTVLTTRTEVKTYYEHIFGFSLDEADIFVTEVKSLDATLIITHAKPDFNTKGHQILPYQC